MNKIQKHGFLTEHWNEKKHTIEVTQRSESQKKPRSSRHKLFREG